MEWYLMVWRKYAQFTGRSRRKEYWMFALINGIIVFIPYVLGLYMLTQQSNLGVALMGLLGIYALAGLIPSIAVGVRRLHDTNKSGWWLLISFVPFVGGLILLILMCIDGDPGDNQYGPNPKLITPAIAA
jgi:uncharacterized membrane protein YhaH (DUF805 family)